MNGRRYSKSLAGLFTSIVLLSLVINPAMVAAGDTARTSAASSGVQGNYEAGRPSLSAALSSSPVMFIENMGQFEEQARFQVRGGNGIIWLAEDAIWVTVFDPSSVTDRRQPGSAPEMESVTIPSPQGVNLRLSFTGANPAPLLEPFNRMETSVNYFIGNDPAQGQSDVPVWGGVRYVDLYPGVDLEIASENGFLVQRLVARDEADLGVVQLHVEGADEITLEDNALRLVTAVGEYTLPLLRVSPTQGTGLSSPSVDGSEVIAPFVDPQVDADRIRVQAGVQDLYYATFLGGGDGGSDIAVNAHGEAYVTGTIWGSDFPVTPGAVDVSYNGDYDAFVAKLNASGSAIVYASFLGGSGDDESYGIAVDSDGEAFIAGETTSSDFFVTYPASYDHTFNGGWDGFIAKFTDVGTGLWFSTYLGGSGSDGIYDIAIDSTGNAYVTGETDSFDFPANWGFDTSYNGGYGDAFVTKLDPTGRVIDYSTFLGGSVYEEKGYGIAVDGSGSAYVTGETGSPDFPTTPGAYDTSYNTSNPSLVNWDVFAVKLNPAGSALSYGTFLGGGDMEVGYGIAVDSSGAAYVTGQTYSSNFPTTSGAYDTSFNGGATDAFVLKLNAAGSALGYSSFLGGSNNEEWGNDIAVSSSGGVYVVGDTYSSNFPTTVGAFDTSYNGNMDAFVVKMNAAGSSSIYATFLGGSAGDGASGVAVLGSGFYVTGSTISSDFPTTSGAFDRTHSSGGEAFVATLATQSTAHTVRVWDEYGNPINGAQVFRNGLLAGTTGADGNLVIHDLQAGDKLAARKLVFEAPSAKGAHNYDSSQNWAYRVYITSLDVILHDDPQPKVVSDPFTAQTLTIKKNNTQIGFNIVASVEWDANTTYLDDLQEGFQNASNYLYDAADGQMLFERVTIYDNNQKMANADYEVRASNLIIPNDVSNIFIGPDSHIFLGRAWDGNSANHGSWFYNDSTIIHEFGHYGVGLYDSYFFYLFVAGVPFKFGSDCTSADIRTNYHPDINASLMDYAYGATEFSMQGVTGLWSAECEMTEQWVQNGESDWETIVRRYADPNSPDRWVMKTPADYGSVVSGPWTPVSGWSSVVIGNDANTVVCTPEKVLTVSVNGKPVKDAEVVLNKGSRTIYQGKTDDQGKITVMGASPGDGLVLNLWEGKSLSSFTLKVGCATASPARASVVPAEVVVLQPAAFGLEISTAPGDVDGEIVITIKASTALGGVPETTLTQNGASDGVPVALSYDALLDAYTGTLTLDASLPPSGNILAKATDLASNEVEVFTQFALQPVDSGQAVTVRSADGQAELYLPVGSLSASGQVNIAAGQDAGATPAGLFLLGGPYTIQAGTGLALVGGANLSLFYLDMGATLGRVDLSTVQLYQWDGSNWQEMAGTPSQNEHSVSVPITEFGTYALMAEFTPTISGNAGVPGVTLNYTDGVPKTANADDSGNYSFVVSYNWSGTVTPSKTGFIFSPDHRTYSNIIADLSGQNYTALVTISGNAGAGGVTLNYAAGTTLAVKSKPDGSYSITLPLHWSGMVIPSKIGYTFSPDHRTYINMQISSASQNYTATPIPFTISGYAGAPGVTLTYVVGGITKTVISDKKGNYTLTVHYNWSGSVVPSLQCAAPTKCTFIPASRYYSKVHANQVKQNYTLKKTH